MGVVRLLRLRRQRGPSVMRLTALAVVAWLLLPVAAAAADAVPTGLQAGLELYAAKKWSKAFKALKPFAEAGVPEAQALVGQMYLDGKGTAKNEALGRDYLNKAAGERASIAKFALGRHYLTETGQREEGLAALAEAAEAGSVSAMELLGHAYRGNYGVTPSLAESLKWYQRAIDSGSQTPIIYYHVGMALTHGDGISLDPVRGAQLLERAASYGDIYAQTELAKLYAEGVGVPYDPVRAEDLLTDAVVRGHGPAIIPLGDTYLARGEVAIALRCYGAALMAAHDVGNQQVMLQAFEKLLPFSIAGHLGAEVDPNRRGACQFEPSELFYTLLQDYFRGR